MKLGTKSLAGIGVVLAAAIVWYVTRPGPEESRPRPDTGTAIIQQPSGRVIAGATDDDSAGGDRKPVAAGGDGAAAGRPDTGATAAPTEPPGDRQADAGGSDAAPGDADNTDAGAGGESIAALDPAGGNRTPGQGAAPDAGAGRDPDAPRFDLVRIDRDGQAVLAGRAGPNQRVEILLDGKVIDTVRADGAGAFVAILQTPLTGEAQNLQLRVSVPAGGVMGAETASGDDSPAGPTPAHDRVETGDTRGAETAATGSGTGLDAAGGGDAAAPGTPDPALDGSPPRVAASTRDLVRPDTRAGDGLSAGGAGDRVSRRPVMSAPVAPALPGGPGSGATAAPAQGRLGGRTTTAPGALDATAAADGRARTGGADRPVAGRRIDPAATGSLAPSGSAPTTPVDRDNALRAPEAADAAAASGGTTGAPGAAEADTVVRSPAPGTLAEKAPADREVRPGGADRPVSGARSDPDAADAVAAAGDAPETPGAIAGTRFVTSAPVIILPGGTPDDPPTLLTPTREDHKILQPSVSDINSVVLDRISYGETGDVVLAGRGRPGRAVRVYGNGLIIGTIQIDSDGTWALSVDQGRGRGIKLLRMDELNAEGRVLSRIEAPFTYARHAPKEVRQRQVVIQKGDILWRIAEQYYGEGLRYSVIYGANTKLIRDPDLIYPGQVFSVPELVDAAPDH